EEGIGASIFISGFPPLTNPLPNATGATPTLLVNSHAQSTNEISCPTERERERNKDSKPGVGKREREGCRIETDEEDIVGGGEGRGACFVCTMDPAAGKRKRRRSSSHASK